MGNYNILNYIYPSNKKPNNNLSSSSATKNTLQKIIKTKDFTLQKNINIPCIIANGNIISFGCQNLIKFYDISPNPFEIYEIEEYKSKIVALNEYKENTLLTSSIFEIKIILLEFDDDEYKNFIVNHKILHSFDVGSSMYNCKLISDVCILKNEDIILCSKENLIIFPKEFNYKSHKNIDKGIFSKSYDYVFSYELKKNLNNNIFYFIAFVFNRIIFFEKNEKIQKIKEITKIYYGINKTMQMIFNDYLLVCGDQEMYIINVIYKEVITKYEVNDSFLSFSFIPFNNCYEYKSNKKFVYISRNLGGYDLVYCRFKQDEFIEICREKNIFEDNAPVLIGINDKTKNQDIIIAISESGKGSVFSINLN